MSFFTNQKYKSLDYQFEKKKEMLKTICLDDVPREQMSFTERSQRA